jgi:hypothetical protein
MTEVLKYTYNGDEDRDDSDGVNDDDRDNDKVLKYTYNGNEDKDDDRDNYDDQYDDNL